MCGEERETDGRLTELADSSKEPSALQPVPTGFSTVVPLRENTRYWCLMAEVTTA